VFRLDGDLGSVDGQHPTLEVHQFTLNDLHVVAGGEVVSQVVFVGSA